jgi:hypothetical protein
MKVGRACGLPGHHGDWGWLMRFVKFGDEYVAASRIVRVVFTTVKEGAMSTGGPFEHEPQKQDRDVPVARVTVEGRGAELQVKGEAALDALRRFCEGEVAAAFP